ncbi:MAG: Transcriptional regulator MntR [Tenericutes bacterium ADurb.BinA155]|jgi:DtxR family Mn-dependent transcriptional regulator|nr:MAG: Transcriptional regulator MntR [Tenericutes bacterium ADurb.BinA155]
MRQSRSVEDFLEALLMLEEKKEPLETTKVAEILQVSKPAVHQMGHELISKGYITRQDYGDMTLTPSGRKLATEVYHRHKVLKAYLLEIGVSETNAENDCCQIEHVISNETFRAIEKLTKK